MSRGWRGERERREERESPCSGSAASTAQRTPRLRRRPPINTRLSAQPASQWRRHVTSSEVTSSHVKSSQVTSSHVTTITSRTALLHRSLGPVSLSLGHTAGVTSRKVTSRQVTSSHVTSSHVKSRHVTRGTPAHVIGCCVAEPGSQWRRRRHASRRVTHLWKSRGEVAGNVDVTMSLSGGYCMSQDRVTLNASQCTSTTVVSLTPVSSWVITLNMDTSPTARVPVYVPVSGRCVAQGAPCMLQIHLEITMSFRPGSQCTRHPLRPHVRVDEALHVKRRCVLCEAGLTPQHAGESR